MGAYNKLYVAAGMAVVAYLRTAYGLDLGLDEANTTALVGAVTAVLVWAVPNRPPEK